MISPPDCEATASDVPNFQSGRQAQAGGVGQVIRGPSFGIKQHGVPVDDRHLVGGGGAAGVDALVRTRRRDEIQRGFDTGCARGHFHVKRPAIQQVAPPGESLAIGGELQPGQILNRAGRAMLAGNPFGIVESERARLGGNGHPRMKDLSRRFRGIHGETDLRSGRAHGQHWREENDQPADMTKNLSGEDDHKYAPGPLLIRFRTDEYNSRGQSGHLVV